MDARCRVKNITVLGEDQKTFWSRGLISGDLRKPSTSTANNGV